MLNNQWRCDLPNCKNKRFNTIADFTLHQDEHFSEISKHWKVQSACTWPGSCRSQRLGKIFKTLASFRKHLRTHFRSHWCQDNGCTYDKAFATLCDLNRHVQSIHSNSWNFVCPLESCSQSFPRRDKLEEHVKKEHDTYECGLHHCGKVVVDVERENHMKLFHQDKPGYECALPGYESTTSLFNEEAARKHLRKHHSVDCYAAIYLTSFFFKTTSTDIKTIIKAPNSRVRVLPCKICTKQVPSAGSELQTLDDGTNRAEALSGEGSSV